MNNELANEIRSKCDIVDIVGERIPLVARGKNFLEFVLFMMIQIHLYVFLVKNKFILVFPVMQRVMFLLF